MNFFANLLQKQDFFYHWVHMHASLSFCLAVPILTKFSKWVGISKIPRFLQILQYRQ